MTDRPHAIGASDNNRLFGYDPDGTPVYWRHGETPEPANALGNYDQW